VPADAITDDVVALAFDERSDTLAAPLPLELMDKCRAYLRSAFRNVPDVVVQPALLARFCFLPHTAVVAWAQSDSLQVRSENEVVYLLSAWVQAQEAAGCPCSDEQLTQLVHLVRLADCGPSYLLMIVPALDWFESGRKALGKFAMAQTCKNAGVGDLMPSDVPEAWTAKPRERLATCEAVIEFQVDAEELEELKPFDDIYFDSIFVNGFWMAAYLQCSESDKTPGDLALGCFSAVDIDETTEVVPWPEHAAVAFFCSVRVGKAAKRGGNFITGSDGRGFAILDASAASVAALVAPHLEGGQLKGKMTFSDVDLLIRRA
jgi:hypothetical protein